MSMKLNCANFATLAIKPDFNSILITACVRYVLSILLFPFFQSIKVMALSICSIMMAVYYTWQLLGVNA